MMFSSSHIFFLGCRGISKTWTTALFASTKCVLYPGTACVVASATRKQARELVKKINNEFRANYPMFALEIKEVSDNQYNAMISFKNGSTIEVVTANENARCGRANLLIIDEARLVSKPIIDKVLKKFLTAQRHAGYMDLDEYEDYPMETNQEMYLTSGWYSSNWCYTLFRDYAAGMILGKDYFAAALPYQLSIKEKLLIRSQVESDMESSDFDEVGWIMEMCAEFWSGADGALYSYDEIAPARVLNYPYLPPHMARLIPDKRVSIPTKLPGDRELRILSADIALMQSCGRVGGNDATAIFIDCIERKSDDKRWIKNIVYTQNSEGLRADEQALEIRRLAEWYDVDYLVIDARGLGLPVVDLLMADMYDPEYGVTYAAWGCCNNADVHKRCKVPDAPKKIWAMHATPDINSQCALLLYEEFRKGNIRLLVDEEDFDETFGKLQGFNKLSIENRVRMKVPYINTSLTVNELINLQTETNGKDIKVKERSGSRKDRFSSLSYNIYVASELQHDFLLNKTSNESFSNFIFEFRQPKLD